jgi:hypothetical protein
LTDVDALTTLVVRTAHSVYRITVLTPHRREVLVHGGAFFPDHTRACLAGSSFGGSCLKLGWVGVGLHLEFHAEGQRKETWTAVMGWVHSEGLTPNGAPWEVYVDDPTKVEPSKLRTEIYVPVR